MNFSDIRHQAAPTPASPLPGEAPELHPADASSTDFDRAITARLVGDERYQLEIGPEWNVFRGPNGGYLAALLLDVMTRRLGDVNRRPRVLSLHYPRVPANGTVEIRTSLTRAGRSMTWLAAELHQGGELCVAARAAFSIEWPSIEYDRLAPPAAPSLAQALPIDSALLPPFARHYEYRSAFGAPLAPGGYEAVGGYIRPRQARSYDATMLAALSDAWFPSTFAHDPQMVMAATLDLTVHFRDHDAIDRLAPEDFVLTAFRSRLATEGFFEEDGELWSPDGRLLAQSRQLAIAAPLT